MTQSVDVTLQLTTSLPHAELVKRCQGSAIGKCLPNAFYIHQSALPSLDNALRHQELCARNLLKKEMPFTLVKFHFDHPKLSYLYYPEFDTEPHPLLRTSTIVDWATGTVETRDYSDAPNPPLLHRKETFITADHLHYSRFAHLTQQQVAMGLLDNSREIGTQLNWERRLTQQGIEIHNHALACPIKSAQQAKPKIQRHKAAIARVTASKPVRLAAEAGLFPADTTYFDYGCGHGADIEYIHRLGLTSSGWDPHFRPNIPHASADVVNLGYVINVIEDTAERREALINAWGLAQKVLIVAAQVLIDDRTRGVIAYGDGIITSRNTFQKYYEQEELKAYIDQVLGVDAIPIALGIYFVFRDEAQAEAFRASRFRSRATAPRICLRVSKFEEYRDQLQPLMDFYTDRGRLPSVEELGSDTLEPLQDTFGSIRRAFTVVLQATDAGEWDAIADKRRNDLLVYLALSHFGHRSKFKDLSPSVQADIKALFGSYQQACTAADLMLMTLGRTEMIEQRCRQSPLGQQRPNSLWVHVSALDQLDPLLRLYEGCASRTIGRPEEATVVKFHVQKPQITYLAFPNFDKEPHPALKASMAIALQDLYVRYRDYDPDNPPLLHQKDQTLASEYPSYAKFAKLSQQEQKWGLLDDVKAIFDRRGWEKCLLENGAELRGHRVVRRKEVN
ncbi:MULTISPECIES: DNA phosphorothioation-associated putative methyltransferase [Cyanophyceae]|uniref:DNA phosphorothioation-associated putative methyltransferase n=1 Tax=Cyanophyceae TaxID=3028117 RepID=UPI0016858955|nr:MULTISPECIES: DNA phosphorothioation-associated putative methyltransferase [Cyanophyceae]MBD1915356.1 DNA phosphorothioation-associated putative methyltransferase [Phormidium sp. FACHB-77]MBD2028920.1 DNA phosphorothioation-associated putative methyltransferase [Phormidium sp. FACHB-322]MBD2049368.1 DNA phosphorothioation-associated putative methyltransferase [Leptolyngbya sp. FACHB-60]